MSRIIELTPEQIAFATVQARALECLRRYSERPLRATRRALVKHRELMLAAGCDDVASEIGLKLWFRGN